VPYYGYYTPEGVEPRTRIYVEDGYAHPRLREISEVSEAVRGLGAATNCIEFVSRPK